MSILVSPSLQIIGRTCPPVPRVDDHEKYPGYRLTRVINVSEGDEIEWPYIYSISTQNKPFSAIPRNSVTRTCPPANTTLLVTVLSICNYSQLYTYKLYTHAAEVTLQIELP